MEFSKSAHIIHQMNIHFRKYGTNITVQVNTEKWLPYNFIQNLNNVIESNKVDVINCEFQVLKLYLTFNDTHDTHDTYDTDNTNCKMLIWVFATLSSIEYDINCVLNPNFSSNIQHTHEQKKEISSYQSIKYPHTIIKKMKIHHKILNLL